MKKITQTWHLEPPQIISFNPSQTLATTRATSDLSYQRLLLGGDPKISHQMSPLTRWLHFTTPGCSELPGRKSLSFLPSHLAHGHLAVAASLIGLLHWLPGLGPHLQVLFPKEALCTFHCWPKTVSRGVLGSKTQPQRIRPKSAVMTACQVAEGGQLLRRGERRGTATSLLGSVVPVPR